MVNSKARATSIKDKVSEVRPGHLDALRMSFLILDMIPKAGKISAPEIHKRLKTLGVVRDLRSVQRHMEMLCLEFDIERDVRNRPYGYKWKAGSKGLSIPGLTVQESLLLNMAEKYLRNLLPVSMFNTMGSFFEQARRNINTEPNARLERRWLDKVIVAPTTISLLPPPILPGVMENVSQALYYETWLEVGYTNALGQTKQRRVIPLGLAQQGNRMILVVRFEGYEEERSLALNRIQTAVDTGLPFPPVKNFDLSRFDDEGRFGFGEGKRIKLRFRVNKDSGYFLTESRLSLDQSVKDLGDVLEIKATVVQSAQLIWWLRGFGSNIEVISPRNLFL